MTNGLAIMIIVAAYTANLAAFLTVKPEPSVSFGAVLGGSNPIPNPDPNLTTNQEP